MEFPDTVQLLQPETASTKVSMPFEAPVNVNPDTVMLVEGLAQFTIVTPFVPPENFPPSIVRLLRPLTLIAGGVSVAAVKSSTKRLPLAPLVFGITVEVTVPEKKTVSPAAGVLLAL